ncbi:tRNA/rRNA methyltransferase [Paracoccus sanguinis]|uniref:tRNA/rRNA methyltransferase n=2 Tax=Paracoccus sanguinis TaxID=1545044 RepID=A0A1H3CD50_9RHOB|nr:tRNA/rRNA methyltransferase [Paracoccus sanguinis]
MDRGQFSGGVNRNGRRNPPLTLARTSRFRYRAPMSISPVQPVVILVRPQMGENIGAAARAMLNFALTDLRLVAPRDGWPNPRAVAMASGAAGQVLDRARVFPTLAEAMADVDTAYATTARGRELTKPVHTPATAMAEARALTAEGRRVALVFGPERAGLDNDDIARASAIVTVPVNPAFPSLNLAQAVLLMGYEWGREALPPEPAPAGRRPAGEVPATRLEIERLADHWEERLTAARFFFPEDKAASMRLTLRNLWSRLPLTRADVQIFHGMIRQLTWRGRDGDGPGA